MTGTGPALLTEISAIAFRWIALRADYIGGLFAAALAACVHFPHRLLLPALIGASLTVCSYMVYLSTFSASEIGFLLSLSLTATDFVLSWIRAANDVEVEGNRCGEVSDQLAL